MINRRAFGKMVGAGAAAALLGNRPSLSWAATPHEPALRNTSFGPLKQINAGVLNVGYAEAGPADGPAAVLLHGWPYDIHSYVDVAPLLAAEGYRVIVPYLRGHGTTRFLSDKTFRNAQQAVIALDVIALLDALKIEQATLAGFDWGSRTADIIAVLWPRRCKALVSVTGYLITNRESNRKPLPPKAEWAWWYQYYFATERGRLGLEENRHDWRSSSGSSTPRRGISMMRRSIAPRRPSKIRTTSAS
ncbi:alpha/beta hydrolase [Nonomuraea sp. NPDC049141]|uniref:alpha/beta fold hydrolase n=1 Tax=Nonomuraea sp. NPDC049141 TaxID=3155500 RepID=UPI0033F148DB